MQGTAELRPWLPHLLPLFQVVKEFQARTSSLLVHVEAGGGPETGAPGGLRQPKCCQTLAEDVPELAGGRLSVYQAPESVKWTVRMID